MIAEFCKTPRASCIVALPDLQGVYRFPQTEQNLPGIVFTAQPRLPIVSQAIEAIGSILPPLVRNIDVAFFAYEESFTCAGEVLTLYVARCALKDASALRWPTMPDLLRAQKNSSLRIAYLKAWQVLCGALTEETRVLEQ